MAELQCFLSPVFAQPSRTVALVQGAPVSGEVFLRRVAGEAERLRAVPATRFALFHEDALEAAVLLFAAWFAGKCVVLPADCLPATEARLADHVDGWLAASGVEAPTDALRTMEPASVRLEVFTSGSTGEPLAIPKTLGQLAAELVQIERCWDALARDRVVLATVPHQHLYGLLFRILWPLNAGHVFESVRIAFPEALAARLEAAPAVLVSSPAFLRRWPESLALHAPCAVPEAVFSSGGPLPLESSQALQDALRRPVIEIYGSSETGGIAWRTQTGPDTPWRAHAGVEVAIDDTDQSLRLRSPFLPDPAAWYATGDRALAVGEGFRLLGRADRIVKVEEKRVSLDAIEQALCAHGAVTQARAVLLDEGRIGAVLVLSEAGRAHCVAHGARALHQALRTALADVVEAVALPRRWRHVEALPSDALGKHPVALLQALFESGAMLPDVRVVEAQGDACELTLTAEAGLAAFDGHFPGLPVLPGVAQLDWACALAAEHLGIPGIFSGVDQLKFHKPVRPGMALSLRLERVPAKQAIAFRYTCAGEAVSSGRLVFAGDAA